MTFALGVIARLNILAGKRSPSSLKRFRLELRRDLAEIKHNKYLMKADNLFKKIAASSRNTLLLAMTPGEYSNA